ncbi:MAG: hypothetical protein V4764_09735 [Burkholderia sp.]
MYDDTTQATPSMWNKPIEGGAIAPHGRSILSLRRKTESTKNAYEGNL